MIRWGSSIFRNDVFLSLFLYLYWLFLLSSLFLFLPKINDDRLDSDGDDDGDDDGDGDGGTAVAVEGSCCLLCDSGLEMYELSQLKLLPLSTIAST